MSRAGLRQQDQSFQDRLASEKQSTAAYLFQNSQCQSQHLAVLVLEWLFYFSDSARRSRIVKSMKVLLGSSVVCLGAVCLGDGVGESDIIIGLGGVLGVFGGVDSGEDGSWAMVTVVTHGSWISRGCGSED